MREILSIILVAVFVLALMACSRKQSDLPTQETDPNHATGQSQQVQDSDQQEDAMGEEPIYVPTATTTEISIDVQEDTFNISYAGLAVEQFWSAVEQSGQSGGRFYTELHSGQSIFYFDVQHIDGEMKSSYGNGADMLFSTPDVSQNLIVFSVPLADVASAMDLTALNEVAIMVNGGSAELEQTVPTTDITITGV